MTKLLAASLLILSGSEIVSAQNSKTIPTVKLSHSIFFAATEKSAHMPEVGYYHMFDNRYLSHGPSFSLGGFIFDGTFKPTFKFAYEFNYYFIDAKLAVFYLDNDFIFQPSIGFSVFNQVGVLLSSNTLTNDNRNRITSAGLYINLNTKKRVTKKGFE
ncbi:MAG: hypothetical protein JNM21_07345 [Taibaiella sp.]|nr:hypothetical protein [Taibaiella sp.]